MRWLIGLSIAWAVIATGVLYMTLENPFAEGLHRTARAQQTADDILTTGRVEAVRYVEGGRQLADVRLTNSRGNGIVLRNCTTAYPVRVGNGVILDFVEGDPRKGAFISGRTTPAETLTYDLGHINTMPFSSATSHPIFQADTVIELFESRSALALSLELPPLDVTLPTSFSYPADVVDRLYTHPRLRVFVTIEATFTQGRGPLIVLTRGMNVDITVQTMSGNILRLTPVALDATHIVTITDDVLTNATLNYRLSVQPQMQFWSMLNQASDQTISITAPSVSGGDIMSSWVSPDTADGSVIVLGSSTGG